MDDERPVQRVACRLSLVACGSLANSRRPFHANIQTQTTSHRSFSMFLLHCFSACIGHRSLHRSPSAERVAAQGPDDHEEEVVGSGVTSVGHDFVGRPSDDVNADEGVHADTSTSGGAAWRVTDVSLPTSCADFSLVASFPLFPSTSPMEEGGAGSSDGGAARTTRCDGDGDGEHEHPKPPKPPSPPCRHVPLRPSSYLCSLPSGRLSLSSMPMRPPRVSSGGSSTKSNTAGLPDQRPPSSDPPPPHCRHVPIRADSHLCQQPHAHAGQARASAPHGSATRLRTGFLPSSSFLPAPAFAVGHLVMTACCHE